MRNVGFFLSLCLIHCGFSPIFARPQTVANGLEPAGTPMTLVLKQDLRVGPERGDNYLWAGSFIAVEADSHGHIFVTDDASQRIMEYDSNGQFVRQIGGPGEGPGEFQALRSFQILANGAIAFENLGGSSSISYFDEKMKFLDRKSVTGLGIALRSALFSPDGHWIATTATAIDPQRAEEITQFLILDEKFQTKQELLNWRTGMLDPAKVNDSAHWAEFLSWRFGSISRGQNVSVAFDGNRAIYTALAHTYEITKWDTSMNRQAVITRQYKPIPQTEAEIQAIVDPIRETLLAVLPTQLESIITKSLVAKAVELAEFPRVKFPISGLLTMEDGTLLVVHDLSNLTNTDRADIFNSDGLFLGSFSHPRQGLRRMIFRNGYAYTIESDEEDNYYLVRYRAQLVPIAGG